MRDSLTDNHQYEPRRWLTLIVTLLELDYGLKVHDLMFMDDFMMFRCTVECWNKLRNMGISLRNQYEKMGINGVSRHPWRSERRGSLGPKLQRPIWGALVGPMPQGPTDRECPVKIWEAQRPRALQTDVLTVLLFFISKPTKYYDHQYPQYPIDLTR